MSKFGMLFKSFFSAPMSFIMKSKVVPDNVIDELEIDPGREIFYVIKTNSLTDKFAIARACKKLGMPSPSKSITLGSQSIPALVCIENPKPVIFSKAKITTALKIGEQILAAHQQDTSLDAQLIPITICWGRAPGKEKADLQSIIADSESPSWLRKFFLVLFSGRANFIRFSRPVSLRFMADKHGADENAGHKLLRIARFHFYRQKLAATGPRLWSREQMFNSVLSAPSIKKVMLEEVASGKKDKQAVKLEARKLLDEIAADYRESYVRVASRFLAWLWNKLYSGIEVNNAEVVRDLAQQGHEIIYVPCHRSHMDYLLLSYVIFNQGLVPPHIAAGINLNFGPVGPILRRGGAFFLRRSFKGSKLYATIFREYLGQLFMKGYSVKYFTEGGRSRTGRLLQPKTGMLAMTIQALLKGIDRPVTFIPVYLGYEHVMEVTTYLKELKGDAKKSESVLGVFKAMRNLRDYGHGYVNFGAPLTLNNFLNEKAPQWKDSINNTDQQKPKWLTPVCNELATTLMTSINNTTALNATTLSAIILLAAQKHALTREELEVQLDLYLNLQRDARYNALVTIPDESANELVTHLIGLKKVEVNSDAFGEMLSLNEKESVLMTYYRNNIIHLFAVPSLIAAQVLMHKRFQRHQVVDAVSRLYPLFKDEWFLEDLDCEAYTLSVIDALIQSKLIVEDADVLSAPQRQSAQNFQLKLLANIISSTLQRYAIVLNLLIAQKEMSRNELENKSQAIAKRLSAMHGIKSPEFLDKKVLSIFVASLRENNHIVTNDDGKLTASESLDSLTHAVTGSLKNDVMQSITQIIHKA
jgi:glycerol-3-phosphate O-acyltransferase